jgi:hypothetical protein
MSTLTVTSSAGNVIGYLEGLPADEARELASDAIARKKAMGLVILDKWSTANYCRTERTTGVEMGYPGQAPNGRRNLIMVCEPIHFGGNGYSEGL